MRFSLWALACVGGLLGTPAEAREYELHPVGSGVAISGVLTLTPREIDVTRPDYTLIVEIRNDTDQWLVIPVQGARCIRGSLETLAEGPSRPLALAPYQAKELKLRCDHGPWVKGDFGLVLPEVATSQTSDRRTADRILAQQVTWRLRERDVSPSRQRDGRPLAHLSYCLPVAAAPEAPVEAAAGDPPTATLSAR